MPNMMPASPMAKTRAAAGSVRVAMSSMIAAAR